MRPLRSLALAALAAALACSRPLPEEGSEAAQVYRKRCGETCHRAYPPSMTRYPTWEMILPRMEQLIGRSGEPPLTEEERRMIRDYVRRHSG